MKSFREMFIFMDSHKVETYVDLLSADFDLLIQTFFFVKISEVNVPFVNVR